MFFRPMRRKDRMLNQETIDKILENNTYGTLSTISDQGYPYGVPINYVYFGQAIYLHCARDGHKLDNIRKHNQVSFSVVGRTAVVPDRFTSHYESVILFGSAAEVFESEKHQALEAFVVKYAPDHLDQGMTYIKRADTSTRVIKISIDHVSGKANPGMEEHI